jgi:hypothetical protein
MTYWLCNLIVNASYLHSPPDPATKPSSLGSGRETQRVYAYADTPDNRVSYNLTLP